MWLEHWGLERDPFGEIRSPYVPVPPHDQAVARLLAALDRGPAVLDFRGAPGSGKTSVVRKVIADGRRPRRRFAQAGALPDPHDLPRRLVDELARPRRETFSSRSAWSRLARELKLCALEGTQVVLVIDGGTECLEPALVRELIALVETGSRSGPPASLILSSRPAADEGPGGFDTWRPAVDLDRLSASHAEVYLTGKLASAGCHRTLFPRRAILRMHAWSRGNPGLLNRLSARGLEAAARRGMATVPAELVDEVAMWAAAENHNDAAHGFTAMWPGPMESGVTRSG